MKNQVKNFSQYIKESDRAGMDSNSEFSNPDSISLMDLFECYAQTNFGMKKVLISADLNNPARDLTHGGITVTPNPNRDDIMEAIEFDLEWGLYDNGQLVDSYYYSNDGNSFNESKELDREIVIKVDPNNGISNKDIREISKLDPTQKIKLTGAVDSIASGLYGDLPKRKNNIYKAKEIIDWLDNLK